MATIPYSGIRDLCLKWPAGQLQTVTIPVSMPPGCTLAEYASFVLTIREDPDWPRSGANLVVPLDPAVAGGTPTKQATGTADVAAGTVTFSLNAPTYPGYQRYSMDAQALGGTAGPTQIYESTWLTVLPSTR